MKKTKNIGINAVLNVIRQSLSVLFPLITYPYVLRVLGADCMGKVNYSNSIIYYFNLLAMLGITNYAVREGAKRKDNRSEFENFTSQIFSINIISTIFAYLLLGVTVLFVGKLKSYTLLLAIQSISIILTTLSIDWINNVYEDFLLITVRSIATHIISLLLLFTLVKSPADYYKYACITIITNGFVCITNFFHCRKYAKVKITFHIDYKQHLRPILILFANSLAISIYVSIDTTMLGWMKGDYYVGLYSAAVKVYQIAKNVMAAIYVVSVPRLSAYAGQKKWENYCSLSTKVINSLSILLIPSGVGLICLAPEIMMILGGEEYIESSPTLQILGISLIFAIFGGFITAGINISLGREKRTLLATVISSITNFVLNLFLIPLCSYIGAAITTLISEAFVFIFCFISLPEKNKYINMKEIRGTAVHAILGSLLIVSVTFLIKIYIQNHILVIMLDIPCCVFSYFIALFALKDNTLRMFLDGIKTRILKNKTIQ